MTAQDINPALRTELNAALVVLAPMIRGLAQLALTAVSSDLRTTLNSEETRLVQRQTLVHAVLADLDQTVADLTALENDGYPAMPPVAINAAAETELTEELSDLQTAAAIFTSTVPSNVAFNASANTTDVAQAVPKQS